jgi:hypothetical protein
MVAPGCRHREDDRLRGPERALSVGPARASAWTPARAPAARTAISAGPQGRGWAASWCADPQGEELRVPGEQEPGGERRAGAESRAGVPEVRGPRGDRLARG